ncbi:MAG TPA: tRNA pseudouridine(55) synthase TruB [Firmicutes bacterium]|jgi:tRNA pseudouridine55 synthase|nr:tRNA pseudouridine(55) synthase TruB [Bacillota bacterium]
MSVDGFLIINKPMGYTSHQVVVEIRKILHERRVGHTGTLDPMATGVLVIAVGSSTRLISFLNEEKKLYRAKLVLGLTTDTQDLTGRVLSAKPETAVDPGIIRAALSRFSGEQEQIPPMYSAIKVQGQPLYKLARAGKEIPREKRKITIFRLELEDDLLPVYGFKEGPHLVIECSRGTYIRTLCHEIGKYLSCGGCMGELIRLASGPFFLQKALTLDQLQQTVKSRGVTELLIPPGVALEHLPMILLDQDQEKKVSHGQRLNVNILGAPLPEHKFIRGMTVDGRLLAILKYVGGSNPYWQPVRVLN